MFVTGRPTQIEEENDVYWRPESRESHHQIRERGRKFIQWLMARPERRLAVVSHSSFLYFLLSNYGHDMAEPVQSEIRRWCVSHHDTSVEITRAVAQACPTRLLPVGGIMAASWSPTTIRIWQSQSRMQTSSHHPTHPFMPSTICTADLQRQRGGLRCVLLYAVILPMQ